MSEQQPEVHTTPVTRVAQHLTAIVNLADHLEEQAIHKANDHLMPGGLAMVALGGVANLEAWQHKLDTAERAALDHGEDLPDVADDDDWVPPLQTLVYWSEALRRQHGYDHEHKATIQSEANFIRWALPWMWDNEPKWADFEADIRTARARMENLLKDGRRDIISDDVTCVVCEARLRRRMTWGGYEDEWWCAGCRNHLTSAQFNLASSEAARRALGLA